nr:hypothetical protein [Tanacetum cinerariifolium]
MRRDQSRTKRKQNSHKPDTFKGDVVARRLMVEVWYGSGDGDEMVIMVSVVVAVEVCVSGGLTRVGRSGARVRRKKRRDGVGARVTVEKP